MKLRKFLRRVMEGDLDRVFTGLCVSPPKCGIANATCEDLLANAIIESGLKEVFESHGKWLEDISVIKTAETPECPPKQPGSNAPTVGSQNGAVVQATEAALAQLRAEVAVSAKEMRQAWASHITQAQTILATERAIQASSVYKKLESRGGPLKICYLYAIGSAWGLQKPDQRADVKEGQSDKRAIRPTPVWASDLSMFIECANGLITAENECYAVVLVGRAKRQGAGMWVEAGLAVEQQVMDIWKEKNTNLKTDAGDLRVKKITMCKQSEAIASDLYRLKGIAGSTTETVLFFYRGTWPNKMFSHPRKRSHFGGSTWVLYYNITQALKFQPRPKHKCLTKYFLKLMENFHYE